MGDVCYSHLAKYKGKPKKRFSHVLYQLAKYCRFWDILGLLGCREDFSVVVANLWPWKSNLKYRAISI